MAQQTVGQQSQQSYEIAGLGRRGLAITVDWILVGIVTGIVGAIIHGPALTWINFLLAFGYFIVLEGVTGQTVGKMLLGIKVVQLDGTKLTWVNSLVRNAFRVIDMIPYVLPVVGALASLLSNSNQRFGDKFADSVVVKVDRK